MMIAPSNTLRLSTAVVVGFFMGLALPPASGRGFGGSISSADGAFGGFEFGRLWEGPASKLGAHRGALTAFDGREVLWRERGGNIVVLSSVGGRTKHKASGGDERRPSSDFCIGVGDAIGAALRRATAGGVRSDGR